MSTRMLASAVACAALTLGCTYDPYRGPGPQGAPPDHAPAHGVRQGGGPPPHAPAHGYRAKHRSRDLLFDSRRGVYTVVGVPGVYFRAGWYFRLSLDRWVRSARHDGPWHDARWGDVPPGLRGSPGPGKGQGKGKGRP